MQQRTLTSSAFRKAFGQTLDRVSSGERVVITNHNKPWVQLVPPTNNATPNISAFDLRLDIKKNLDMVYYSRCACAVVRKGEVVADIVPL